MSWVKTISDDKAKGRLEEVYGEIRRCAPAGGKVPGIIKCLSLRPEALERVWRLNMGVTFGASTLGRAREEMLALAVSARNSCRY